MSTTPNATDIAAAAAAGCRGYPIWCDVSGGPATMFISNPLNGKFVLSRVTDGSIMGEFQTLALATAFAAQTSSNTSGGTSEGNDLYISSQRSATNAPPNLPGTWYLNGQAYTTLASFLAAGGSI